MGLMEERFGLWEGSVFHIGGRMGKFRKTSESLRHDSDSDSEPITMNVPDRRIF
jgi:hypothetical protein